MLEAQDALEACMPGPPKCPICCPLAQSSRGIGFQVLGSLEVQADQKALRVRSFMYCMAEGSRNGSDSQELESLVSTSLRALGILWST